MNPNHAILKASDSFKKHPFAFTIGPALKMLEAAFDLLIPLFMKAIMDLSRNEMLGNNLLDGLSPVNQVIAKFILLNGTWIQDPKLNFAIIGGVYILLMGIVGFLTTMLTQYIAARTAVAVGKEIRDSLYQKILHLSKKEREQIGNNKLLTILNADSYQVQQGVLIFIRLIVRAPFIILGSLFISFLLYWQIGIVYLAIIPLILLVIFYIMRKSSKEYLKIQERLDNLSNKTSDTLEGAKVIRAFNTQQEENDDFKKRTYAYQQNAIHVQKLNALINPLTFAIIAIATVLVVIFGASPILTSDNETFNNNLSTTIITEIAYLSQIFFTLVQLTNIVMILTKARVSISRVNEVLSLTPSIQSKEGSKVKAIEKGEDLFTFKNVSLGYEKDGNYAIKDISFSLKKGESLGIIGGTGSGKSTLISLMERFLDTSKGTILYKGVDIKDYPLEELRNELALVPQKSSLFKGTLRSNMKMANPNATDEEIFHCLKDSLAEEFVKNYDDLLDHEVEEGGKNYSGGQRQRLCIARALLKKNSEAILLDDSTSALDLLTDKKVRDNISSHYNDISKIIVSQRVATVKDCDLILVLEGGSLIAKGNHETLLNNCKVYQETYESQTKKEVD